MTWLKQLFSRRRLYNDLSEEIRAHLDEKIEELITGGMPRKEATAAARREFGNVTLIEEDSRRVWGWSSIESFFADVRFGARLLRKNPGFAAVAILTLGLGIGATTVVFSVLDNVLLEPFPFKNASRYTIFYVHDTNQAGEGGRPAYSAPEFFDFQEQNHVFEQIMGASNADILYTNRDGTRQFNGAVVTSNAFEFLGVPPLVGRPITSEDGKPGSAPVFAMSYRLWQREFAGDPQIVGTTLTLNGRPRTLVSIMPPRFLFDGADVWIPIRLSRSGGSDQPQYMGALGILKSGVTLRGAAADLNIIAHRISKIYPREYPQQFTVRTVGFADAIVGIVGHFKPMLYTLIAAVSLLLLIACSNVANLLLARATVREKEISLRASLGASRSRLVRQLLVETLVLAAAGCALGCLFAYAGLRGVAVVIPRNAIATEAVIELSHAALLFALGVGLLTTLLSGLAPALHAARSQLQPRLASASKGASSGFRHGKLRGVLVIVQVALSIVLLVGAGLMIRSFFELTRVDLGFNPVNVLCARVPFPTGQYDTAAQQKVFFRRVLGRVASLPGVIAAAEAVALPPYGGPVSEVDVPGQPHSERWDATVQLCSEEYFHTLERGLLRGRLLSETDVDEARQVAVINQTLARNFFGNENPIGRTIKFNLLDSVPDAPHNAYFDVIGIVGDAKNRGLQDPPLPEAYIPYTISSMGNRSILVRTAIDPSSMSESIRREIWAVDSKVALTDIGSLESFLKERAYTRPEFALMALGTFAVIGLALVAFGVFSVMQYSVSLQTQEIGVRVALGAQRRDILSMVLWKGLRLIVAGIIMGLLSSLVLTRFLAAQIWGISSTDPLTFSGVSILLALIALAACYIPARRAMHVDPIVALRSE
jgi:putative ABC transport system permease protein